MSSTALAYRLSMPEPHRHLFEVAVRLHAPRGPLSLVMPSWTPGSYLLREFPRNVQEFSARAADGSPLAWRKTDKNSWEVEVPSEGEVEAVYRVYANELTVRTSHLDASHAYVNGASVFMYARGREHEEIRLSIDVPAGWRATTSLAVEGVFLARDYDELVDSPIEIGTHQLLEWQQDGKPHRYAIWGRGNQEPDRLIADTRRIIDAVRALFGSLPYEQYTFLVHLFPGGRGGLEHRDSCSLQAERWAFTGEAYESFLALVAHEFFHVWNAKRIRPEPLGPFDYTAENYTRNLWVVEGITTYYTDLILRRAGLITPDRYLTRLSEAITRLQQLPGRRVQSLADSSFDTWIKFYRPDENSPNSQISYYHKGALVALLLDLRIRRATENARSLDDVMRLLWERYGRRDAGFPEDPAAGIRSVAEEVCGEDLGDFFRAFVDGTEELDHDPHLAVVGLRLEAAEEGQEARPGLGGTQAAPSRPAAAGRKEPSLGVRTKEEQGRTRNAAVLDGTPAARAGVNAGDELLALDGLRVSASDLSARLKERSAGEVVELTVFRRDELMTLRATLEEAAPSLRLVRLPNLTERQEAAYAGWLGVGGGGRHLDGAAETG